MTKLRMIKGGSLDLRARLVRAAFHNAFYPEVQFIDLGFRLCFRAGVAPSAGAR